MPAYQGRTRRIHLVATDDEYEMAKALADKKGLTVSDIVRVQLREAYEREFGAAGAAPKVRAAKAKRAKK